MRPTDSARSLPVVLLIALALLLAARIGTALWERKNPPRVYDRDLLRIFSDNPRHRHSPWAAAFIRHHRATIRRMVSKWTNEYQLTLDTVLDEMIERCREMKLRAVGSDRQLRMDFTVLLTAKTVHSLYSPMRRQWIAL